MPVSTLIRRMRRSVNAFKFSGLDFFLIGSEEKLHQARTGRETVLPGMNATVILFFNTTKDEVGFVLVWMPYSGDKKPVYFATGEVKEYKERGMN